jgi:hypothetical protein
VESTADNRADRRDGTTVCRDFSAVPSHPGDEDESWRRTHVLWRKSPADDAAGPARRHGDIAHALKNRFGRFLELAVL